MPSILIETGFISNKKEEAYLASGEGQKEIAGNITSALKQYIGSLDNPAPSAGIVGKAAKREGLFNSLAQLTKRKSQ
jgi:N-acetylmuramoyl-L-alanine amidase